MKMKREGSSDFKHGSNTDHIMPYSWVGEVDILDRTSEARENMQMAFLSRCLYQLMSGLIALLRASEGILFICL